MLQRYAKLSKSHSFFLFGPRGSGKSTLIREKYLSSNSLLIDLLNENTESRYLGNADLLLADIQAKKYDWVIIDEVQKVPKLF